MTKITVIVLLFSLFATAQHQNNQWRFGYGGSIDFNTDPPSGTLEGTPALATIEGSASVADPVTGTLLFYTDGITIWNKNNQPMPNGTGLFGSDGNLKSSTSAAVIVPKPFCSNLYYVFTIPEQNSTLGLRYSVVDMTLDSGAGDVIGSEKNVLLANITNSEKITAVPDASGCGYWLIAFDGSNFLSYRITSEGIASTPVVSPGIYHANGEGHFKVSQQLDRIAMGHIANGKIELFDFDNATGVVDNPVTFKFGPEPQVFIYGLEFSPDGSKLYASNLSRVVQYDILQATPELIASSGVIIHNSPIAGALQLGPDGKIYVSSNNVLRINHPNLAGAACDFQTSNVIANPTGAGVYGLPQKIYSLSEPVVSILNDGTCQEPTFSLSNLNGIVSVVWNFDDPMSLSDNTSSLLSPVHRFTSARNYNISAIITYACRTITVTKSLSITLNQTPLFNAVLPICAADSLSPLPLTSLNGISGTWTPALNPLATTTYTFTPSPGQCANTNTLTITVNQPLIPEFEPIADICAGAVMLPLPTVSLNGIQGSWSPSTINSAITTTYIFTPDAGQCATTLPLTIVVTEPVLPVFTALAPICLGQLPEPLPITSLNGISGEWFPSTVDASTAATYTFVPNAGQCALSTKLTTVIKDAEPIQATVAVSYPFDDQNIISVTVTRGDVLGFQLDDGAIQTEPVFENVTAGVHSVKILSSSTCFEDLVVNDVFVVGYPRFFTPNGDGFNDRWHIAGALGLDRYTVTIFDRHGKLLKELVPQDGGWDGTYNGTNLPSNDYWFVISFTYQQATQSLRGHFALKR